MSAVLPVYRQKVMSLSHFVKGKLDRYTERAPSLTGPPSLLPSPNLEFLQSKLRLVCVLHTSAPSLSPVWESLFWDLLLMTLNSTSSWNSHPLLVWCWVLNPEPHAC